MARAVCENSRSAVISGPRSERASTVRKSRRKLFFCTATLNASRKPEQKEGNTPGSQLVAKGYWLEMFLELGEAFDLEQALRRAGLRHVFVLQNPGVSMGNEHRVQTRS
jgi:hypothetical protein